jgi:hypothetical protein
MSARLRIAVVGDTLLDVDVSGTSERLSPDAPVPVVDVRTDDRRAGGAGLVATMLAKDGHDVRLVTVLGDDAPADRLRALLPGVTIVEGPSGAPTPVKTRVRVGDHALVRIDEGCDTPPVPAVTDAMRSALEDADAVIVADYGRGLTAAADMRAALKGRSPRRRGHRRHAERQRGAALHRDRRHRRRVRHRRRRRPRHPVGGARGRRHDGRARSPRRPSHRSWSRLALRPGPLRHRW